MNKNLRKVAIVTICVALIGWIWFIFRNSLKTKPQSAAQSAFLSNVLRRVLHFFGLNSDSAVTIVRKCAHVFEFFVLAVLVFALLRLLLLSVKKSLAVAGGFGVIAATADEVLQIFSHRGPAVSDVLIDCSGVVLALAACWLWTRFRSKRK